MTQVALRRVIKSSWSTEKAPDAQNREVGGQLRGTIKTGKVKITYCATWPPIVGGIEGSLCFNCRMRHTGSTELNDSV